MEGRRVGSRFAKCTRNGVDDGEEISACEWASRASDLSCDVCCMRPLTNGSALVPYREVDAIALVTNSAGLQARPENCYTGSPGPDIQVMNSNLCAVPARAYPEHTYGLPANSNRRSPMGDVWFSDAIRN